MTITRPISMQTRTLAAALMGSVLIAVPAFAGINEGNMVPPQVFAPNGFVPSAGTPGMSEGTTVPRQIYGTARRHSMLRCRIPGASEGTVTPAQIEAACR